MGIVRALARCVALCAALVGLALASPAGAQTDPNAEGEALANRGYASFRSGDFEEAIALFQQAEALSHSPVILSFIAQSYEALGKLIEAERQYAQIVGEALKPDAPEDFVKAQQRARQQVPLLRRRFPRLQIRVSGVAIEDVAVALDGQSLGNAALGQPIVVNPGERAVVLKVEGHPPVTRRVTAAERQVTVVDVLFSTLRTEVVTPPQPQSLSWLPPTIAFGVGFAGITLGAVTAALHFDRAASLNDRCPDDRCPPELETEADTITTLGVISLVGLGVGVLGVGTGMLLILLDEGETAEEPDVALRVGLGHAAVEGTF